MSDIAKCEGMNCPIRESCYRHTAKEGHWQSWIGARYDKEKKECEFYWELKK